MDNRTEIINKTLMQLQTTLNDEQLSAVRDALYVQLNDYEVTERCTDIVPADGTPKGLLRKFIATKRIEGKSEKTLEQYSLRCSDMLDSINKMVEDITTYDLRFYLASCKEVRKVSNRTLENIRCCISSFFGWLNQEEFISKNPAAGLGRISCKQEVLQPFTDTEMEQIRGACPCLRDRAIVEFLYSTGCRISEAIALNRNDIDFIRKSVTVTGKGNKQRIVYMSDVCVLYLQEYLESRADNNICLFASLKATNGDPRLSIAGVESMLHKLEKKSGVSDIHPHRFRRTLATNLIARGAAMQDVSAILGHSDISTTQIYCAIDQKNVEYTYRRCIA